MFKGSVRGILLLAHQPRIQKSAAKGLPQPRVVSKPLNLTTTRNHQANPALIYLVPFWTHLYLLLSQHPVATSSTIKLTYVRISKSLCLFWSYYLTISRDSICWITLFLFTRSVQFMTNKLHDLPYSLFSPLKRKTTNLFSLPLFKA